MSLIRASLESMPMVMFPDGRMDVKNAARYLGLKEKTLAMMRCHGTGPCFIKRGRIFYYKDDLDNWLHAAKRVFSTAEVVREMDEKKIGIEKGSLLGSSGT